MDNLVLTGVIALPQAGFAGPAGVVEDLVTPAAGLPQADWTGVVGVPGFPHADLIGVAGVGGSGCTGVVGVVGLLPPPKRDANLSWSEARFLIGDAATGAGGTGAKAGPFFPGRAGDE